MRKNWTIHEGDPGFKYAPLTDFEETKACCHSVAFFLKPGGSGSRTARGIILSRSKVGCEKTMTHHIIPRVRTDALGVMNGAREGSKKNPRTPAWRVL